MFVFLEAFQTWTVTNFPGTNNSVPNDAHWWSWTHCDVVFSCVLQDVFHFSGHCSVSAKCSTQYVWCVFYCSGWGVFQQSAVHLCFTAVLDGGVFEQSARTIESSLHEIIGSRPGVPPRHASLHRAWKYFSNTKLNNISNTIIGSRPAMPPGQWTCHPPPGLTQRRGQIFR